MREDRGGSDGSFKGVPHDCVERELARSIKSRSGCNALPSPGDRPFLGNGFPPLQADPAVSPKIVMMDCTRRAGILISFSPVCRPASHGAHSRC